MTIAAIVPPTVQPRHEGHDSEGQQDAHHSKHYANVNYGYNVLMVSLLYIFLLYALRNLPNRPSVTSLHARILNRLYNLDPVVHMSLVFIPLLITFPTRYSFFQNIGLYVKRLGRLSYALVPLNLILSLKPPTFPFKQGYTYDQFIPLHKWLSRLIFLIGIIHGVGFLLKWISDSDVSFLAKCLNPQNFIGIVIFVLMIISIVLSIGVMRRRNYSLFYVVHKLVYLAFIFGVPVHARPGVAKPYIWICCILLIIHSLDSIILSKRVKLNSIIKDKTSPESTTLSIVNIPRFAAPDVFPPGTHLRISPYGCFNPLFWLLPSHPYTICSAPEESQLRLIVTETKFKMMPEKAYTVLGTYPSNLPPTLIEDIGQQILIVCGGSGIGYGLAVFKYFKHNTNVDYLKVVWLLKKQGDYEFLRSNLDMKDLKEGDNLSIFITGDVASPLQAFDGNEEAYEMQTNIHNRRINWTEDLDEYLQNKSEKSWMICCGPKSLVNDACLFAETHEINFISEFYSI